MMVRMYHKLN